MADDPVDALYELDLDEFVAARDALAKALRSSDREAAAAVKKLRRPTVAAWALNQLARRRPELVEGLLAAGAEAGDAQEQALAGKGGAALREASKALQRAVAAATRGVADMLGERAPAHEAEVQRALTAAGSDAAVGEALRAGRLSELPAGGDPFGGFELPAAPPARPPKAVETPPDRDAGRDVARDAERRRAEEALAEAERAATRAEEAATAAEAAAREATARRAAAEQDVEAAQHALEAARRAVEANRRGGRAGARRGRGRAGGASA